jgi:hypothetical protein
MAPLGVVRCSLSFPDTSRRSSGFVSRLLSHMVRLRGANGLAAPGVFPHTGGTPPPDCHQETHGLSEVPAFPL